MPPPASPWRLLALALAATVLGLPAWWNGQPLFYPDTPTYLRGAEMGAARLAGPGRIPPWVAPATHPAGDPAPPTPPETGQTAAPVPGTASASPPGGAAAPARGLTSVSDKVVLAGRSVYYGALLYASHLAGSLWWAVAAQALCVAWVLHLLLVRLWGLGTPAYLGLVTALAATTPLAVYTGLLMPDVFAGLAVLAVAILAVHWRRLSRADRGLLAGLLLFALASHASHVALALPLLLLALVLRLGLSGWQGLSLRALGVVAACIVAALAAEWGFALAVTRAVGAAPLRLPHLTARLVDMGPGTAYLRARCPPPGAPERASASAGPGTAAAGGTPYAACAFTPNYPTAWTDFLFSTDPHRGAFALADAATKRRLSQEQLSLALDVLRHDPAGVGRGVASDLLRQLVEFRVDVWGYGPRELAMYAGRIPDPLFAQMKASRANGTSAFNDAFTALTYAGTLATLGLALYWARRRRLGAPACVPHRMEQVAVLAIAGLVANAMVCAALASPMDRFQARLAWLPPMLALSALALAWRRRRATAHPPPIPRTPVTLQGAA